MNGCGESPSELRAGGLAGKLVTVRAKETEGWPHRHRKSISERGKSRWRGSLRKSWGKRKVREGVQRGVLEQRWQPQTHFSLKPLLFLESAMQLMWYAM